MPIVAKDKKIQRGPKKSPKPVKHIAPAGTVSEMTEKLGITEQEIARVRKVLLKRGYLKD